METLSGVWPVPTFVVAMFEMGDYLTCFCSSKAGYINLYTVRHDPGRFIHSMKGHTGPVSALSISHDEKGFFSAGQDGDAVV